MDDDSTLGAGINVQSARTEEIRSDKRNRTKEQEGENEKKKEDSRNASRSEEDFRAVTEKIKSQIGNYAVNESKWSGNIVIDNSLFKNYILGRKDWSCSITLIYTADDGVIWHEMLHSCSASYYSSDIYSANEYIEEASVEFLKQQICLEQKIESLKIYKNKVTILSLLNSKFKFGINIEFAKELFNVPLPERYQWLEEKVNKELLNMDASLKDCYETMDYVRKLEGGSEGE